MSSEYAIIGGGIVGLSIAHGLLGLGKKVTVFDEGDGAFRASRGNFGLIWVQSKGLDEPAYAKWSKRSAAAWGNYADELSRNSGLDLSLQQNGGFDYHLTEESLHARAAEYEGLKAKLGGDYPFEVLGHNALKKEEPAIGPKVAGAILHHDDGHVNPLRLLQALASEVRRLGGEVRVHSKVGNVEAAEGGYKLSLEGGKQDFAERVVLSAGLGAMDLGPKLGFAAPVRPQRGQVLITEKLPPLMNRPAGSLRQVNEGGVQIGASKEEVGLDDRETLMVTAGLAKHAIDVFPALAKVKLVRSWSALRIMSPDGLPIYQHSQSNPGVFLVTCHSGITLSAAHSKFLPLWMEGHAEAPDLTPFSEERFDV
jgi:glycine/D-amino acid oxidase-like deaminating enzyme